jgi:hypothetical protein
MEAAAKRMRKTYVITCKSGDGDILVVTMKFRAWSAESAMNFRHRHERLANSAYTNLAENYGALHTEFTKK